MNDDKKLTALQKKLQAQAAANNALWAKSSKTQRKILVAQDVIHRIKTKQFQPETGVWAELDLYGSNLESDSVQEYILNKETCQCCALGGLIVSQIACSNKVTVDEMDGGGLYYESKRKKELDEFWGKDQTRLMELAFEGGNGAFPWSTLVSHYIEVVGEADWDDEKENKENQAQALKKINTLALKRELGAWALYKKYKDDKARLLAIMKNIVENKGVFDIVLK